MEDDDVEQEEDDDVEGDNVEEEDDNNVAEDEVEDHDVAEDEVEDDDVEDDDVKGGEDNDVDVEEEEEEEEEEDDDVEKENRSQDRDPHFVRACALEMHFNISQEPLYTEIYRKMPRPRISPERRHTLYASLRGRNALQHFTRATLYRNLQEKCHGPESAQNADTHFVQACAVEMHFNISQEPLYTEIYRKNATAQNQPRTQTHTLCEPAQSKCTSPFHKTEIYRKNAAAQNQPRTQTHTLCEPAQPKCTSTFHKSHFIRKFTGKMPAPRESTLIKHRPLHLA